MIAEKCPKCGEMSLITENVMGSTKIIYLKCNKCCYKEKRSYGDKE